MKTDDLISLLAADTRPVQKLGRRIALALALGAMASAALLLATIGIRQGMETMIETPRVLFKISLTLIAAASACRLVFLIGRPAAPRRAAALTLLAPLALLMLGVATELAAVPRANWAPSLLGRFPGFCLVFIPTLALAPLAAFTFAMREGAPENPGLAGAAIGLASGAIAAAVYAWHCPDDSPLFVAAWYGLAITLVTLAGAAIGRWALRW